MSEPTAELPVLPVILSGGIGSRLWPLSRETYPKQFLDVAAGGRTLVQQTLERLEGIPGLGPPIVKKLRLMTMLLMLTLMRLINSINTGQVPGGPALIHLA